MNFRKYLFLFFAFSILSCEPKEDMSIDIGELPAPPDFSMEASSENPNMIVLSITSTGFFDLVWDLPGATPNKSVLERDTVFYPLAGNYTVTLHAAKEGGSGTSSATKTITIDQDADIICDPTTALLTGDCTSKCWKLSEDPGSIQVGPTPFSAEWFNSPDIAPAQASDRWCFEFEGGKHQYMNGGVTFSACQGFVEDPNYTVPTNVTYQIIPSGTTNSEFKIVLDDGSWMGVEDSGPEYEIVSITESEMVLLSATLPCDGSPSTGWFTLTFVKE